MEQINLSQVVSSLGLLLDIIGVIVLFRLTASPYKSISEVHIRATRRYSVEYTANDIADSLLKSINEMIKKVNEENDKKFAKSKNVLWLIIIGFAFQLASVFL